MSLFLARASLCEAQLVVDPSFMSGSGANAGVSVIYKMPGGGILVAGGFDRFDETGRTNIVLLTQQGSVDAGFLSDYQSHVPSYMQTSIYCVAATHENILLGGFFGLYRVSTNGAFDLELQRGLLPVNAVTIQPDGKVLVAEYGSASYLPQQPLVRLNASGGYDDDFECSMDQYRTAFCLRLRDDGSILVGGDFVWINGHVEPHLALIDSHGSPDPAFLALIGNDGGRFSDDPVPYAIELQPDGKILIGGAFTSVDSEIRGSVARLNADGSLDASFNPFPGETNGFDGIVYSMALQDDGKLVCAGDFTSFNGVPRHYLARLNADGSLDADFNSGAGPNGPLRTVVLDGPHRFLIGGSFTAFDGIPQGNISRLLEQPRLSAHPASPGTIVISWPTAFSNCVLQVTTNGILGAWRTVTNPPNIVNGASYVANSCDGASKFYRLAEQ